MTTNNPRAGWEKIGDQFYRKVQLYESVFDPDLELENYLVAGAPYCGALGEWVLFCRVCILTVGSIMARYNQSSTIPNWPVHQVNHRHLLVVGEADQQYQLGERAGQRPRLV